MRGVYRQCIRSEYGRCWAMYVMLNIDDLSDHESSADDDDENFRAWSEMLRYS